MATACETVVLGGFRELPRRVSPRCQPRPGRWLRRKGACGGFARGFRGEGGLGCLWQLSDSDGRETGASAVPRPSLSNRKWVVDIFSHPPRKTAFSSAELALWRPRCGAVLWLQRLCDATRRHAVIWVVMPTFDDDHAGEDSDGPFETPLSSRATAPYRSGSDACAGAAGC